MTDRTEYQRYRAPQEDGQSLVDPPRAELANVVAHNRQLLAKLDYDVQGRALAELAASARRNLVTAAVAYTREYRDLPEEILERLSIADEGSALTSPKHPHPAPPYQREEFSGLPIVLSGHQPQLFHPGVWYKNFVLGDLAHEVRGVGVHLLIDSDLCRTAAIRVPTGSIDAPRAEAVAYDQSAADVPFEERRVNDEAIFESFARRTAAVLRPLVAEPLVEEFWPLLCERAPGEDNLGLRVAKGRHALEGELGNHTLELPQSAVCQIPEFSWFVMHVLAHLPRFWAAHNDALATYRRAHRLRNHATPVPDLSQEDRWLEAPFWIWSADDPRRRAMFVRPRGDRLEISDRHERTITLSLSEDCDAALAADELRAAAAQRVKIRTRALATTLFARLFLGDLFLHGIGGAKYDQVTDEVARQFFGFSLPLYATASATLRLPIDHPTASVARLRRAQQQLRELEYHPENFLPTDDPPATVQVSTISAAVAEKRRWVDTPKTAENARQRHRAITDANRTLQPFVESERSSLERQVDATLQRLRANSILDSREYSFCLFPREHIVTRLLDAVAANP